MSTTTHRPLIRETNKNGGVGISRNANEKINIVSYALSIIQKVKERHEKNSNAAKYWVKTITIAIPRVFSAVKSTLIEQPNRTRKSAIYSQKKAFSNASPTGLELQKQFPNGNPALLNALLNPSIQTEKDLVKVQEENGNNVFVTEIVFITYHVTSFLYLDLRKTFKERRIS